MSFAVDLSNELYMKELENETRLTQTDTTSIDVSPLTDNGVNSHSVLHLTSHTNGLVMDSSENSDEDHY